MIHLLVYISLLYLSNYIKGLQGRIPIRPFHGNIMVTENCNSRCITCNIWKTNHENEYSTEELENIMEQMRSTGIKEITFTGGEPTLRNDISVLVRKARKLGFKKVSIVTNGLLLSNKAEDLVESGITRIFVSIDGIGKKNDAIRGVSHHYEKAIEGINAVKQITKEHSKKVFVYIHTTLNKQNIGEIPELLNLCKKLGIQWRMNVVDKNPYFFKGIDISKLWINDTKLIDKTINYLEKVRREEPDLIDQDKNNLEYLRNYMKGKVKDPPCILPYIMVNLDAQGNVYPGCWVLKPIGNLRKDKLKDILQSKEYEKMTKDMYMRKCPGCICNHSINVRIEKLHSTILNYMKTRAQKILARAK